MAHPMSGVESRPAEIGLGEYFTVRNGSPVRELIGGA